MELTTPLAYTLKRSGRRRTIALRVDPQGIVRVSAPLFAPRFWIDRVVQTHWPWVLKKQAQYAAARSRYPTLSYISGNRLPLWGEDVRLELQRQPKLRRAQCIRSGDILRVALPILPLQKEKAQILRALRDWYWKETEARIAQRIDALAAVLQVRWSTFKAVNQKARWGSCSRHGKLRFNGRLSLFPPHVLEYVLVHELAHIREPNHSSRFWTLVASAYPDYKTCRSLLRQTTLHTLL